MERWKTQIRNKIEDSNVEEPVKLLADSGDQEISASAKRVSLRSGRDGAFIDAFQLLEYWSTLELSYRIPRVSKIASVGASHPFLDLC